MRSQTRYLPQRTLFMALFLGTCLATILNAANPFQSRTPAGVEAHRNIEYIPNGHERHKLDVFTPTDANESVRPLIVWVHGGAWLGGSKDNCPAVRFVNRGYVVASINYRLSRHAKYPAQIEDCKAAIRFLRAHAKDYGIDPNRVGVWGSSAGGHLVALLGTTGDVKQYDKGENLDQSSRVQAVCDFFGPTDFTLMSKFESTMDHDSPTAPEALLIGGPVQENKDLCKAANPITYVTKDDPPFLICHGNKDPLVPHNQSVILDEALTQAKVESTLHIVEGGGHGGWRDAKVNKMVEEFFDKHLKAKKSVGIYDSRAIAVAYCDTPHHRHLIQTLGAALEEAKKHEDKDEIARCEAAVWEARKRLGRQAFCTAGVDDLLEVIADRLPDIRQKAGVDCLISKWDTEALAEFPDARTVDVTDRLVDAFEPNERQRTHAANIRRADPVPIEEFESWMKQQGH